ncbi:hypothetical protein ACIOGZ_04365 [Kitasatospora sp. NPDC088160]|uniref:hypothetical protein n=1 Tax=Kitasatospora sp. NPDC088160 TaxID=3364072 RepID=UPI0037F7DD1A
MRHRTPNTEHRTPNTEHRTPNTEHRTPNAPHAPVFGLAPEWLLSDGVPLARAMVLSHPEQLGRLREACPEAAPTAVLGGDPCFDRILAALPHRERHRRAFGVRPGQRLVVLNSTWNPQSLFGDAGTDDPLPWLLDRLTAELPVDDYRVAAVLHPNIWHGHGPGQVRLWLDRAERAGLTLIDPLDSWRQALIAADAVIGDFGSVSYYAAALGTPVLLGTASDEVLGATSPVAAFVREAPRLALDSPLRPQLDQLLTFHQSMTSASELTTSAPGEAAGLLRSLFYEVMGLPEPTEPALLDLLPLPDYRPPTRTVPLRVRTRPGPRPHEVTVERVAEGRYGPSGPGSDHLAVHEDTLDQGLLGLADAILRYGEADDPRIGPPREWAAATLARYPNCSLAAFVSGPDTCEVLLREWGFVRLTSPSLDPAAAASALFAQLDGAAVPRPLRPLPPMELTVRTGGASHPVLVSPVP